MATKARQQYFADEVSLSKEKREFSIADEIQQKIDSIEEWAQVNKIETVKVNWTALVPDANKAVNIDVPEVIDNLYTVDSDNALSAKQWKLLYDYIQNIASRWRFLSNWNSATGLPMTNPSESPYPYKSWDYFVVSNVATGWGTNYRPDGSSYTIWQASTVVETDSVDVSDFYFYDGTNWLLLKNSGRSWAVDSALSTTSTNPVENRVITNALNWKQETLIAWNNIQIAADWKTISATDTTYSAWANISIDANNEISATDTKYTAWTNVQISNQNVISATDTKYTAGTWISIDANNVISNTQTSAEWWNITWTLSDQTDLQSALDDKQDELTAWNWISIDANNEISNTLPWAIVSATAPSNPTEWMVWYDTTEDSLKAYNWTSWETEWTEMVVLSYWHSTWQEFIDAYNKNAIVYCKASSQSNPWSWNQTRMAFMAYVNSATPTEVEFQYYRSRSDHNTAANQLDQVFVYKLTSASWWTWTVTERNTWAKAVAWTWISLWWGSGNMTISADTSVLATKTDLNSKQDTLVSWTNIKTVNNESLLWTWNITISAPTYTAGENITIDQNNEISATDTTYTAGEWIAIWTVHSDMQWPAPDGFHVPSKDEWADLYGVLTSTFSMASNATTMGTYLKMPMAGSRDAYDSSVADVGSYGEYWFSTPSGADFAYYLYFSPSNISFMGDFAHAFGYSVRCFKDTPVIPTSSWTTLYQGSWSTWVFYNATDGLISVSGDWQTWYTIQDKNLWATTVFNQGDTLTDANCGYFFQWGNNYWFAHSWNVTTSSTQVDASGYWPWNYYNSSTFITRTSSPWGWSSVRNDNLWWWVTQWTWIWDWNTIINTGVLSVNGQTGNVTVEEPIEYTAWNGISIWNLSISSRQWPCEEWFHVPSAADWQWVETIMNWLWFSDWADWDTKLHLPKAWYRRYSDGEKVVWYSVATWVYWSTSRDSDTYSYKVFTLAFDSSNVGTRESECRAIAASIRPFKNAYVAPDATWTVIYGTLWSAWIFWNQTEWLISITDWTNGYTMADKNLWATTVYSSGNTLSEANCGYLYQWWNNYAFPWSWSVTTSSTLVNASSYWPGNYYSSSTFITVSSNPRDWSSVQNNDLWWDTTNTTTNINNAISNTGVLSINWQTWNITIETFQLAPNSPLNPKYRRYWTQAQYEALTQYYTDEAGDTVYFTI